MEVNSEANSAQFSQPYIELASSPGSTSLEMQGSFFILYDEHFRLVIVCVHVLSYLLALWIHCYSYLHKNVALWFSVSYINDLQKQYHYYCLPELSWHLRWPTQCNIVSLFNFENLACKICQLQYDVITFSASWRWAALLSHSHHCKLGVSYAFELLQTNKCKSNHSCKLRSSQG